MPVFYLDLMVDDIKFNIITLNESCRFVANMLGSGNITLRNLNTRISMILGSRLRASCHNRNQVWSALLPRRIREHAGQYVHYLCI